MNPAPSNLTDEEIIEQVIAGEYENYRYLIERYKNYVFSIVMHHVPMEETEELAHEVFISAYKALANCKNKHHFQYWLKTIAVRKCYDYWRKTYRYNKKIRERLSEEYRNRIENIIKSSSKEECLKLGTEDETKKLLDWLLNTLSPEERMVLKLIYFDGLSVKETADLLGWSIVHVKVQSFRSKRKLQKIIKERLNQDE